MRQDASAAPPKRSKIPWIFFGFFAAIFLANGIMIAVALGTWTGLETDSAYRDGLAYNERLAEREAQRALGWRVAMTLKRLAEGEAELQVRLTGAAGETLYADEIEAVFWRPTLEGHDQALKLRHLGAGLYGSKVVLPLPGQWQVKLSVLRGDKRHESQRRVVYEP